MHFILPFAAPRMQSLYQYNPAMKQLRGVASATPLEYFISGQYAQKYARNTDMPIKVISFVGIHINKWRSKH